MNVKELRERTKGTIELHIKGNILILQENNTDQFFKAMPEIAEMEVIDVKVKDNVHIITKAARKKVVVIKKGGEYEKKRSFTESDAETGK